MMRGHPGAIEWIVFLLCSTGILTSWTVIYAVFFRTGVYAAPALAGVYVTLLEGGWAFGMIYGMNPDVFPPSFCRWQAISVSCGAFGMTSAFCLLAVSVFLNLRSPASQRPKHPLAVSTKLMPAFVLFPAVCTTVFAVVAIKHDAIGKSWIICDAVDPPWVRLVSYAGLDWILIVPTVAVSTLTVRDLLRMRRELSRVSARAAITSSSVPPSPNPTQASFAPPQQQWPSTPSTIGGGTKLPPEYPSPATSPRETQLTLNRDRHLSGSTEHTFGQYGDGEDDADAKSVSPSLLSSPSVPRAPMLSPGRRPQGITQRILEYEGLDQIVWGGREIRPSPAVLAAREEQRGASARVVAGSFIERSQTPDESLSAAAREDADEEARRPEETKLAFDAILRVMFLLLVGLTAQALASISPLIAVAHDRVDRGFGTQHLAGFAAGFAAPMVVGATPAFHAWVSNVWCKTRQKCRLPNGRGRDL